MSERLYLLAGWSFGRSALEPLRQALADPLSASVDALPGHGDGLPEPPSESLAGVADALAARVPEGVVGIGWSLGGTALLELARRGVAFQGVVVLATTPRFTATEDWPDAVPRAELAAMQAGLARSPAATVRRFRRRLARVSSADAAAASGAWDATQAGLAAGLAALAEADLRPALEQGLGGVPVLWIGGDQDPLVPPEAVRGAAALRGDPYEILPGAGHQLQWTHAGEVAQRIRAWVGASGSEESER